MISVAIVESVTNNKIIVSTIRKGACGDNCAMCGGCNAEKVMTEVMSEISVNVGDTVRIVSNTKYVMFALFCVFLLPVFTPLLAYIICANFCSPFMYVLPALIFVASVVFVFVLSKSTWFIKRITPEITDIIKKK